MRRFRGGSSGDGNPPPAAPHTVPAWPPGAGKWTRWPWGPGKTPETALESCFLGAPGRFLESKSSKNHPEWTPPQTHPGVHPGGAQGSPDTFLAVPGREKLENKFSRDSTRPNSKNFTVLGPRKSLKTVEIRPHHKLARESTPSRPQASCVRV